MTICIFTTVPSAATPNQIREALLDAISTGSRREYVRARPASRRAAEGLPSNTPPPPQFRDPVAHLRFTRLKALVEEGCSHSLAERTRLWKQSPGKVAGADGRKRKPLEGTGGPTATTGQEKTGPQDRGCSSKARMLKRATSTGAFEYASLGVVCPRVSCGFSHDQIAPAARPVTLAPQWSTTPSPAPSSPPQQQQRAAAAGDGGAVGNRPLCCSADATRGGGRGRGYPGPGAGRSSDDNN